MRQKYKQDFRKTFPGAIREFAIKLSLILLLVSITAVFAEVAGSKDMSSLFPDMPGWRKIGEPALFDSTTLYKQIDGAAELFIMYGFDSLAVLSYEARAGYSLNVEIYRHNNARNAFGIFSRERSPEAEAVPAGGAGYYSRGILNFNQGRFYVKLAAFGLGRADRAFLSSVARGLSAHIPDRPELPKLLKCFPDSGRIENSERYFPADFLGHEFLHSAFSADYGLKRDEQNPFRIFIIEGRNSEETGEMLMNYLEWANKQGCTIRRTGETYSFKDPDHADEGSINLKISGRYIWGLFSDSRLVRRYFMEEIENNLGRQELLE